MLGSWFQCSSGIYLQYLTIRIAVVYPFTSYNYGLWYHYIGGIIPFSAKNIATVDFNIYYYILGSCSHYLGGNIFLYARYNATVLPSAVYKPGSCSQNFGILTEAFAIYIATVHPKSSYNYGSWFQYYSGISLQYYTIFIATVLLREF